MIDPKEFSKSKPVVKPADLKGHKVAVVTVEHVEKIELNGDAKIVMQFEEFEGMNYFPNLTSIRNLVDGLGNDEVKWLRKRVVLEVVKANDPQKKRQVEVLWVAAADTWDDHFRGFEKAAARAEPPTPITSAKKKTTNARR